MHTSASWPVWLYGMVSGLPMNEWYQMELIGTLFVHGMLLKLRLISQNYTVHFTRAQWIIYHTTQLVDNDKHQTFRSATFSWHMHSVQHVTRSSVIFIINLLVDWHGIFIVLQTFLNIECIAMLQEKYFDASNTFNIEKSIAMLQEKYFDASWFHYTSCR